MKITDRLASDHRSFEKLIADIDRLAGAEAVPDPIRLIRLVELLSDLLSVHGWGEDNFYYPAVRRSISRFPDDIDDGYMDRMGDEHAGAVMILREVEAKVKQSPPDPAWKEGFADFKKRIGSHIESEESVLFPLSEEKLGDGILTGAMELFDENRRHAPEARARAGDARSQ